jgi:hypothetical protein
MGILNADGFSWEHTELHEPRWLLRSREQNGDKPRSWLQIWLYYAWWPELR